MAASAEGFKTYLSHYSMEGRFEIDNFRLTAFRGNHVDLMTDCSDDNSSGVPELVDAGSDYVDEED